MSEAIDIPTPPRPFFPLRTQRVYELEFPPATTLDLQPDWAEPLAAAFPETQPEPHEVSEQVTTSTSSPLDPEFDLLLLRVGFYIHSRMAGAGMLQEEIAQKTGLDVQGIDNLILGRNSDLTVWQLFKICKVFGVSFTPNFADKQIAKPVENVAS